MEMEYAALETAVTVILLVSVAATFLVATILSLAAAFE
jgi:hypothetical protein